MGLNRKLLTPAVTGVLGIVAIVYGVALVSVPAAWIVLGVMLVAFATLPDWGA